jgi:hypothetical protein
MLQYLKAQNEIKGNSIDWSLMVLQKEEKFTESDNEIKMAILKEISSNTFQKSIGTIISEVHSKITIQRLLMNELDKLMKESLLAEDLKKKFYIQAQNQILNNKLLEPYSTKGLNCIEWQYIIGQFKLNVNLLFFSFDF